MDFLRARTQQQIEQRQLDIINACDTLFEQGGYDNVNMKAISEMTAITRSSIYTYYKTKDEIILDLLYKELLLWKDVLLAWAQKAPLSKADFCKEFTEILVKNEKMLKHYCLLYSFLEINCRLDKLVIFKQNAIPVVATLVQVIKLNFPTYSIENASLIAEEIMAYILGIYPTTHLTAKQKEALALSGTNYHAPDFITMCENGVFSLLR